LAAAAAPSTGEKKRTGASECGDCSDSGGGVYLCVGALLLAHVALLSAPALLGPAASGGAVHGTVTVRVAVAVRERTSTAVLDTSGRWRDTLEQLAPGQRATHVTAMTGIRR
jgi:hypothetical protein